LSSPIVDLVSPEILASLVTLIALEIVLGIDNIVMIAVIANALPEHQRDRARIIGLSLALITRLLLLFAISWIAGLVQPLFTVWGQSFSGRDFIMLGGGLFLIWKAVHEMHGALEEAGQGDAPRTPGRFSTAIAQIVLLDIVFSFDSVITAVGMATQLWVMIAAMIIAVAVMLVFARAISEFVDRHPSVKMLALSFLILIGMLLMAEGLGQHIDKAYVYFAMGFSLFVELLNIRRNKHARPVHLHAAVEPSAK
jgi:predicted tellurium resistance membrane protein TerC